VSKWLWWPGPTKGLCKLRYEVVCVTHRLYTSHIYVFVGFLIFVIRICTRRLSFLGLTRVHIHITKIKKERKKEMSDVSGQATRATWKH